MGKVFPSIDAVIRQFIEDQPVFFVGTAPLEANGYLNVSPKGLDTFRVLGPNTVAYLDLTGSGIETVAHLKQNGRIVVMFCAFQGSPRILRLHGRGRVVEPEDGEFESLSRNFPSFDGARTIIVVDINRISDSCGYAVPLFGPPTERSQLHAWTQKKGPEGIKRYKEEKNRLSIDGLPGLGGG